MRKNYWLIGLVCAAIAILVVLLLPRGRAPVALAQQSAAVGYVIGLTGAEKSGRLPVILIDTKEQAIIAYEYNYSRHRLILVTARSYRYDRQLQDYSLGTGSSNGLDVDDVRKRIPKKKRLRF